MQRFFVSRIYEDPIEGWVPAFWQYRGTDQSPNLVHGGWTNVGLGLTFGQVGFVSSILADMQGNSDMLLMDDWPLGMQWASVPLPRRTEVRNTVHAFGLTFTVQGQFSILQVLDHIVEQIKPGQTAELLNVQDMAG